MTAPRPVAECCLPDSRNLRPRLLSVGLFCPGNKTMETVISIAGVAGAIAIAVSVTFGVTTALIRRMNRRAQC